MLDKLLDHPFLLQIRKVAVRAVDEKSCWKSFIYFYFYICTATLGLPCCTGR